MVAWNSLAPWSTIKHPKNLVWNLFICLLEAQGHGRTFTIFHTQSKNFLYNQNFYHKWFSEIYIKSQTLNVTGIFECLTGADIKFFEADAPCLCRWKDHVNCWSLQLTFFVNIISYLYYVKSINLCWDYCDFTRIPELPNTIIDILRVNHVFLIIKFYWFSFSSNNRL